MKELGSKVVSSKCSKGKEGNEEEPEEKTYWQGHRCHRRQKKCC